MRVDPDSIYLELAGVLIVNRKSGNVRPLSGVRIHWKEGNRWRRLLLVPDEYETIGELLHRVGDLSVDATFADWLVAAGSKAA